MNSLNELDYTKIYRELAEPFVRAKNIIAYRHKQKDEDVLEFYDSISQILTHEKVREMKQFNHHSQTDCFTHSVHVAYYNYKMCKFFNLDKDAAARAGMLHDLFLYDWHNYKREKGERMHGFEHPKKALANSKKYFELTALEEDMISKHMFPLTISLPKYRETFVIIMTDKFCSSCEVLDRFFKKKSRRLVHLAKVKRQLEQMVQQNEQ